MNDIDALIAGIGGGFFGAAMVLFTARFHWKRMTREYEDAKNHFQDHMRILDINDRLTRMENFIEVSLKYKDR